MEDLPDEELLERFLYGEVLESQDAFRALVERHSPWILDICRQILNGDHDAEDAVQATFLTLARRGASIVEGKALAGWALGRRLIGSLFGCVERQPATALEREASRLAPVGSDPGTSTRSRIGTSSGRLCTPGGRPAARKIPGPRGPQLP